MSPTKEHLIAVGVKPADAETWLPGMIATCAEFEINTHQRIAAFLAQCAHESGGFTRLVENVNYSAEALMRIWPKRFPNLEFAQKYHRNPEKIANSVYSNRMGNGSEVAGDGWKYRGRGLKQLTGKYNYTKCGQALGIDLVNNPDLLLQPLHAARSAGWFWATNNCAELADSGEFEKLTKRINGGLIGLADRKSRYEKCLAVAPEPTPEVTLVDPTPEVLPASTPTSYNPANTVRNAYANRLQRAG